jgi:hypothetical protein
MSRKHLAPGEGKALVLLFVVMVLVLAIASGCAAPIDKYVKNFPTLEERVHKADSGAIYAMCYTDLPAWQKAMLPVIYACTYINLKLGTADIYTDTGEKKGWEYEHEHEHTLGGDHGGTLQAMYDQWVSQGCPRETWDGKQLPPHRPCGGAA